MVQLTPTQEDTAIYELAVLYPPLSQKEEQALLKEIEALFTEVEGIQMERDLWGRRGLAYTIGGYDEGCYAIYYYELKPEKVAELDKALRILPGVLRHMFVKPPKGYEVTKFSDSFKQWKKEQAESEDRAALEREEALKKRVAEKAKRQAKRVQKEKTEETPSEQDSGQISEKLEKLISDDDLDI